MSLPSGVITFSFTVQEQGSNQSIIPQSHQRCLHRKAMKELNYRGGIIIP
jgi:hypothetical protein